MSKLVQKDLSETRLPKPITEDDSKYFKIISWNVNGMNALTKKEGALSTYVEAEDPDVIVFQETKFSAAKTPKAGFLGAKYPCEYWSSASKNGYSGTGLISKTKPISVTMGIGIPEHDDEGRVITAEYEHFYLICNYVPNAGQKLERLSYRTTEWDPAMLKYLQKLEEKKPIIWTGDLNVAHQDIDIHSPKTNQKTAGFTPAERKNFTNLLSKGFIDTYRHQHPNKQSFSYWGYRGDCKKNNKGWRLDYFIVSQSLLPMVGKSFIRAYTQGSDHCPIGLLVAKTKDQDMKAALEVETDDEAAKDDSSSKSKAKTPQKRKEPESKKKAPPKKKKKVSEEAELPSEDDDDV